MRKPEHLSIIVIYGQPGVGKTTLAEHLYNRLACTAHFGADHIKRFISQFREIESHNDVSRKVVTVMVAEYLKNGINVILEQGMTRPEIESVEKIAKDNGADFFVYRLEAPREVTDKRAASRHAALGKPLIPKETLDALYQRHTENDYPSTQVFDSSIMTTEDITDAILKDLKL